jgi:hypothetical protein
MKDYLKKACDINKESVSRLYGFSNLETYQLVCLQSEINRRLTDYCDCEKAIRLIDLYVTAYRRIRNS